jgi:hypothetical protein
MFIAQTVLFSSYSLRNKNENNMYLDKEEEKEGKFQLL